MGLDLGQCRDGGHYLSGQKVPATTRCHPGGQKIGGRNDYVPASVLVGDPPAWSGPLENYQHRAHTGISAAIHVPSEELYRSRALEWLAEGRKTPLGLSSGMDKDEVDTALARKLGRDQASIACQLLTTPLGKPPH